MRNPVRFWTTPKSVATIPHAMVKVGSQSRGVVRLRMMLHGIWRLVSAHTAAYMCLGTWQTDFEKHIANKIER